MLSFKRLCCLLLLLCLPRIAGATPVHFLEGVWDTLIFWEHDSDHHRRHNSSEDPDGSTVPEIVIDVMDDNQQDSPGEGGGSPPLFPEVPFDDHTCGPHDPIEDLIVPPELPDCGPGQDIDSRLLPGGNDLHSPVPEPFSLLLLSFGAGTMAAASRRRLSRSSSTRA